MTKKNRKERYRVIGGKQLIEVRVKTAQQLFDARDPAPFRDRDLDDDFSEYITTSADEFSRKTPLKIVIYIAEAQSPDLDKDAIREGIHSFITYQIELKRMQLTKLFKMARLFLFIGLVSLAICLTLSRMLIGDVGEVQHVLKEGLIIFGWVSLWKPFELILFDWYPAYDRIRLFRKMLETEIEVIFEAK